MGECATLTITFIKHPVAGVALSCRDGAYLYVEGFPPSIWQITVVGPMVGTPGEYVDQLQQKVGQDLRLREVFMMTPASDVPPESVLRRGFLGMLVTGLDDKVWDKHLIRRKAGEVP